VDVSLTPAGIELSTGGAAEIAHSLSPMTASLSPAETRRLTALLERMLAFHPGPFHPVSD